MTHHHQPARAASGVRLTRRATLGGIGAALTLATLPRSAAASVALPQRLVVINMLGGVDGLAMVVPYGDAALAGLRGPLLPPPVGSAGGLFDLGGFYGLTPAMPNLYAMFTANQALAVHAVAPIVPTRSHFLGQNVLQGGEGNASGSGWINRLTGLLPTIGGGVEAGVVMGLQTPPIAQGATQFCGWGPSAYPGVANTLAALIETLGASDPLIGGPIQSGFNDHALLQGWINAGGSSKGLSPFAAAMRNAGLFLAASGGPAVAVIETASMDTHSSQVQRLNPLLSDVDAGLGALANAAGAAWASTVVMTVTEFGRTAYVNGSGGTDHGSGFAMLLAGGAVKGGRVLGTWPGLGAGVLLDGRDLQGTTDIRAVALGVLRDHMRLTPASLATVFPGTGVSALSGLIA